MRINLKQPKYILPLIFLPFVMTLFYIYRSNFSSQKQDTQKSDTLQGNLSEVSQQVKTKAITDKLEAYRSRYKAADGYTALGDIAAEQAADPSMPDLYNSREKQLLDSINQAMKAKYAGPGLQAGSGRGSYPADVSARGRTALKPSFRRRVSAQDDYEQQMAAALSALNKPSEPARELKAEADAMSVFRQQMALVDSMGKADDPQYKAEQQRQRPSQLVQKQAATDQKLPVVKASRSSEAFNTVKAQTDQGLIQAIVDQDVTGFSGSRLRIRLLDELLVGKFIVPTGSYLYALISGFSAQRVTLSISSIMLKGQILPVQLEIYDRDGLPGLYVPASAFREFSRELGSGAGQGISIQQLAETNNQLVMGMLQRMFQSTSSAVSKMMRSNKAKIKYNTQVFLVDPQALKNTQNTY